MKADAFLLIVMLGVLLSLVMTIYNWRTNKNSLFLSSFLIILCIEAFTSWHYFNKGYTYIFAILFNHVAPLYTFKAPLLYFFIRGTIRDQFKLSPRDYLHFLPALIHLILIIPYFAIPFSDKLVLAESLKNHPELYSQLDLNYPYPHVYNLYFRSIQTIFYTTLSYILLLRFKKSIGSLMGEIRKMYLFSANWLIVLLGLLTLVALLKLLMLIQINLVSDVNVATQRISFIFETGIFIYLLIPVILILYPRFLYGFPAFTVQIQNPDENTQAVQSEVQSGAQTYSSVVFQNLEKFSAKILEYMEREKPFLKTDFKISDISTALDIPVHHVQLCISIKFGTKFSDFTNDFRIKYACRLMKENGNKLSPDLIGEKSGFENSADFNESFRMVTGVTPLQWQQMEADN